MCPDWVDLVCNRGTRCKLGHPEEIKQPEKRLNICRDYQNTRCCVRAAHCTRKHLTRDEESTFYKTGEMPEHRGEPSKVDSLNPNKDAAPIECRDELKPGGCRRGPNCTYRHVNDDNYAPQMNNMRAGMGGMGQMGMGQMDRGGYQNDRMEPPMKRTAMMADRGAMMSGGGGLMAELQMKDEKIDDFRRKIHDLRNMNDLLYEQNEDLRKRLADKEKEIAMLKSGGQAYTSFAEPDVQSRRVARDADLYD